MERERERPRVRLPSLCPRTVDFRAFAPVLSAPATGLGFTGVRLRVYRGTSLIRNSAPLGPCSMNVLSAPAKGSGLSEEGTP